MYKNLPSRRHGIVSALKFWDLKLFYFLLIIFFFYLLTDKSPLDMTDDVTRNVHRGLKRKTFLVIRTSFPQFLLCGEWPPDPPPWPSPVLPTSQAPPDPLIEDHPDLVQTLPGCDLKIVCIASSLGLLLSIIISIIIYDIKSTWQAWSVTTSLSCHRSFLFPTRMMGKLSMQLSCNNNNGINKHCESPNPIRHRSLHSKNVERNHTLLTIFMWLQLTRYWCARLAVL